jgi:hypothetical protein
MNKSMNNKLKFEISSDFDNFKIGLINRIINNYEDTIERQHAIDKIQDVTIDQAIKHNAFCKEVFPILWNATPPQNEKDYCHTSQSVYVRITGGYNKELKVKCYFHGNNIGNPIKGHLFKSEIDKITPETIIDVIKEAASREVLEESNIKLDFIDDTICSLNIYDNNIVGNYEIISNEVKHNITIYLSSIRYELLKKSFNENLEEHQQFMENTGEISGLIFL